jgi:hypothetical protein
MRDAPEDGKRQGKDDDLASRFPVPPPQEELDPELLKIPRKGIRIGWLLALSVVVLCCFLLFHLRRDLAYSRASSDPVPLEGPDQVFETDRNTFVEVDAVPDRTYLAVVFHSKASDGPRVVPVLGTAARLWILLPPSPWSEPPTYREVYRGRLQSLSDMPFAESLSQWVRSQAPIPRPVAPGNLRRALAGERLTTLTGDVILPKPDTAVDIVEVVKGSARITASATSDYPDEAHWRAALVRAGLLETGGGPESASYDSWTYRVRAPNGISPLTERLVAAKLFGAEARPDSRAHRTTWDQIRVLGGEDGGITIGLEEIPWADITEVSVALSGEIPGDARVILTDQHPDDYWYVSPLCLVLILAIALFGWAFVRTARSA